MSILLNRRCSLSINSPATTWSDFKPSAAGSTRTWARFPRKGSYRSRSEETGLIGAMGNHGLRVACRQALKWQAGRAPVRVAVNISAVQFTRPGFVNSIVDILRETGLRPGLLELELTESALIRDRDDGIRKMQRLKNLDVHISIDDFGTGYFSLSYLQNMPLDALKIDRSFTMKLGSSQTALSMVRSEEVL